MKDNLRLVIRRVLAAAASIALLGCGTAATTVPSAAQPQDDRPTAADTPLAYDHHGHDPSWFWGEPLDVAHVGDEHCYTSAELAVLVSTDAVQFDAADKAPGCAMGPSARSIEVLSEQDFRGVVGEHILIAEQLGSDIYRLTVFDSTGSGVYVADEVPPSSKTHVDVAKRQLVVGFGIELPESCAGGLEEYAAQEAACWPEVQEMHPVLKGTEAPGCDCGPGGLWPYPILYKRISLDAPSESPVEVLPLVCGCSS